MLKDLLAKLEAQHGIDPTMGQGVLNTIVQHIKEKFPMVGGMLDSVMGGQQGSTTDPNSSIPTSNSGTGESTFQKLEDLAKGKLGGLLG